MGIAKTIKPLKTYANNDTFQTQLYFMDKNIKSLKSFFLYNIVFFLTGFIPPFPTLAWNIT